MTILREYIEGRVRFLSADVDTYSRQRGQPTSAMPVFYNPRMRLNRDISVILLSSILRNNRIRNMCEPFAGCGIRTLRYLRECSDDLSALMFDINPTAVEVTQKNIELNELTKRATIKRGDARILLLTESVNNFFDFIDIDPFGTPAPFLNAAIQSMSSRGGLLAVTATDMPVLCGVHPDVAQRRYGGISLRSPISHEIGARLLIGLVFIIGGMNEFCIRPLAVLSADHYLRAWLWLNADPSAVDAASGQMGLVRYCPECMQSKIIALRDIYDDCEFTHAYERCNGIVSIAGPLWIGNLYDPFLLRSSEALAMENQEIQPQARRLISWMYAESTLANQIYIDIHALCDRYGYVPPSMNEVMQRLVETGHRVSRTSFRPTAIRTDAPVTTVVEVVRRN